MFRAFTPKFRLDPQEISKFYIPLNPPSKGNLKNKRPMNGSTIPAPANLISEVPFEGGFKGVWSLAISNRICERRN